MKKCAKLVSVMLVICMILSLFGACVQNDNPTTIQATPHSITVAKDIANGKVTVDKSTAKNGETVKVTATPNENYVLTGITANGNPVENGQFVMGDEDVVVSATFALNTDLFEQNPGVEGGTSIKAPSMGGGDANAQIFTVFGETGIEFTAYVADSGLADKDGMAILFSKKLPTINQLLPNGQTIKLEIRKDGKAILSKTDAEGKLVEDALAGSEISLKLWTKDGKVTTGYIVRATVTYEALGVTKDTAKGNVTICPVVYNAYGSVNAKATALNGANENAQNTFPVLSDDNTYLDNPFKAPSGTLGSDGGIMSADTWDLSKDYYKEDTENYPNRVVNLTGHDNMDNNLVFVGVSAAEMYAEATIRVTGVANPNDQWPKFGLMLFNGGGQSGLFYYVDAAMSGASGNTTANIVGTALGYNKGESTWGSWVNVKDSVFDLGTLTIKLAMVYQDGWAHLYANDQFVESIFVGAYNEDMHFGFKSFGLELEVTNYMASTDAEADGWAHLKREKEDVEKLDILFAGDSYMDFWNNSGFYMNINLADYTDSWANEGIGGTWVPLWIDKAADMAQRYNPKKIAFHIGVNDIDGGATVEATVENLKTLFATYHELFPNAEIYWNELIPNTMFASKVPEYYQVNEQVKAFAADKEWLVFVEQAASFEKEPGVADPMYFYDGLHMSAEIGYPIWAKNMLTAMGYTYEEGTTMGSENGFAHTGGWTYTDGTAYLGVGNEMTTYFKGAYGQMVYVEAMVTIGQLYGNDAYPKFGYVMHGTDKSVWGLVDAISYPSQLKTDCAFVLRENVQNGEFVQREGWNWSKWVGGTSFEGDYSNGNYIKMAIAKLGSDVYLLVNGKVVARTTIEGEVTVGFEVFNLETTIKDVVVIKDETAIKEKLGLVEPTSAVLDGKADDAIWTEEVLGNSIKVGDKGDGRYFETAAVKAPEGVYFLVTTYSYENTRPYDEMQWFVNANVEFRIGNDFGPQVYVFYKGPGFNGGVGMSANVAAAASDGGVQLENGLWKATMEFLVPYDSMAGCDVNTAEIPVSLWGWVFDEGWKDGMNVGQWNPLTVSEHGLRFLHDISVKGNNSAVTVTPSVNKAAEGETVTLTVETTATIESLLVWTQGGQKVALTDNTFVMPNEPVIIEVTLKGISVVPAVSDRGVISCEAGVVVGGQIVTFTVAPNAGFKTVGVSVNGEALTLSADGSYTYTVKNTDTKVNIEAQFDYDTEGWTIDGIMGENEAWGEELRFLVEGNRAVSVWAVKGANGVYFYVRAYTDTMIDTYENEWYTNHNFEFYLNHGIQRYVNTRNEAYGATKWMWNSVQVAEGQYAGKWMHTTEIFVQKDDIPGFADGDVILNYAFKASWENARYEYMPDITWGRNDWWRTSLGAPDAQCIDYNVFAVPSWLKITGSGIINTRPVPTEGVVDAELNEYEGKNSIYAGNENAYFHIMGYEGTDGVYLAFEIWQKNRAEASPDWWLNDNMELRVNGTNTGFTLFDDFANVWGHVNSYAMKRVESDKEGYAYKTIVEIYVKTNNPTGHSYLWVGCNGNGFGGWQELYWDGNMAFINEDGVFTAAQIAVADGLVIDGKGDDAIYAGKSSVTLNPNGATMVMTGAKTEHGAAFLFTYTHTKPADQRVQADVDEWWTFLNLEIFVGYNMPRAAFSAWLGGWSYWCTGALTTTDNGDGTYTTVMEVFVPYGLSAGSDVSGDIMMGLGGVFEHSFAWCIEWHNNIYLTDNGVEYK